MYSAETAVALLEQLHRKKPYNDAFPHRPLFAFYTNSQNANAFSIDVFGAQTTAPLRSYAIGRGLIGHGPSYSITNNEAKSSGLFWGSNVNSNQGSSGYSPGSGYVGISQFTQMGCANWFDLNEEYYWNFDNRSANLWAYSGVIVGEPGYRQGINLVKVNNYIGVVYQNKLSAVYGNVDPSSLFIWTNIVGLRRLSTDSATGFGDIAYNRLTNTLAFIERRTNGSFVYRLHIFKNLPKLKADAYQLLAILSAAASSAGSVNYETVDFTWSGVDNSEWNDATRIIPCDDGSFWLARMYPSSGLYVATITAPSGGTRAFNYISMLSSTTTYGRNTDTVYGIRHMNSDDGSVVAVYCPYYYYLCGFCIFFLDRRSISGMMSTCYSQDSTYGYSIAPAGGPNFVMDYCINNDGQWARGWFVNLESHVANKSRVAVMTNTWGVYNIAGSGGSTNYGGSGVIKVQPMLHNTTEYKERNL